MPILRPALHRRTLLKALTGSAVASLAPVLASVGHDARAAGRARSNLAHLGPLGPPDANGVRLPTGFRSRIVARAGAPMPGESDGYRWHDAPDGGAVFASPDGGWVYVSNSELPERRGGVGALRFDRQARLVAQYALCSGTSRNCAGGPTPWGSWLSCEEVPDGQVWECAIDGRTPARVLPALGRFNHEAAAVDPVRRHVYLTEDTRHGAVFRFVPSAADWPRGAPRAALSQGVLQLMVVDDRTAPFPPADGDVSARWPVRWVDWLPGSARPAASRFAGGEGLWIHGDLVYFATKGDDRVWRFDAARSMLSVAYDDTMPGGGVLTGVDNLVANDAGDVLVAEDGGDMQIVAITTDGQVRPLLQVVGHDRSEIAGPAFSPDGTRLYFSSQSALQPDGRRGITYEVTGPFVRPG